MSEFNRFDCFFLDLGKAVHDFSTHDVEVYLTNTVPSASDDSVKADLAGITEENGYAPASITPVWSETSGVAELDGTNVVITASGGDLEPFRYVVFFNPDTTAATDPLIGWYDYGSTVTVEDGQAFTVTLPSPIFQLTQWTTT